MKRTYMYFLAGVTCFVSGAVVLGNLARFYIHNHEVGQQLLNHANAVVSPDIQTVPAAKVVHPQLNGLLGEVQIPSLSLTAPILEGTDDREINVAVGHLKTSVMPGQNGTSVLAAHNATWFRHIDELEPGQMITVETQYGQYLFEVTKSKVVKTGDPIANTSFPSIVLEACYPLNALYLTPYRYLVYGNMVRSVQDDTFTGTMVDSSVAYHVVIPERIRQQGVTLETNALPMGTLSYQGHPADAFIQGSSPLNAASALVQLYLAWVHAASMRDQSALHQLLGNSLPNNPLEGVPLHQIKYETAFDVTLHVEGTTLMSAVGTTTVNVDRPYRVEVRAAVSGTEINLTSVQIQ